MKAKTGKSSKNVIIGIIISLAIVIAVAAVITSDRTAKRGSGLGEEFTYDLTEQKKIDPELILYEESAPIIKTGFVKSTGVALGSDDKIYVSGDQEIRIFNYQGQLLSSISLNQQPQCLAVAEDGKVFVGMTDHVEVYDNEGKLINSWEPIGDNAVLTSIDVSQNDVFAADAGNRVVLRYDKSGQLLNRIGAKDTDNNVPGFIVPSPNFDLAMAADGLLRVVNPGAHLIEAYTPDGHREFWWGEYTTRIEGFSGCCNPTDMALLRNGEGFVTAEKGLTRVKIHDADGDFVGVVAGPDSFVEHDRICAGQGAGCTIGGLDVAVDSQGRVLVLDTLTNELRFFTRKVN